MSLGNKIGEHDLVDELRMSICYSAGSSKRVFQARRYNQVAQAQTRKKHLTEGSDVNDALCGIKSLQRGERASGIAKLAVIIIFKYPGPAPTGPLQQHQATDQAHSNAEWKLER